MPTADKHDPVRIVDRERVKAVRDACIKRRADTNNSCYSSQSNFVRGGSVGNDSILIGPLPIVVIVVITNEDGGAVVTVVSTHVATHVETGDVTVLQASSIGYAVANYLVDTTAYGPRKPGVVERRGVCVRAQDVPMEKSIDVAGGTVVAAW